MIWVTDAKAFPDYRLWIRFSDNIEGEIDLKDFIASDARPIVAALRDLGKLCASDRNDAIEADHARFDG